MNRKTSATDMAFGCRIAGIRVLAAAAFAAALGAGALEAGSIFMKNGYIIQGPIVDQDENMVVLGWPNGKVFIYRRFLDAVVLDPEEEAALQRLKAEAPAKAGRTPEAELIFAEVPVEELPASFEEVVAQLDATGAGKAPPGAGPGTPGTVVDVVPVPPPTGELGPRQTLAAVGLSVEPPSSWTREDVNEGVRWVGPQQEDGFRPSLVIISTQISEWDAAEARKALREDPGEMLADFTIVQEGDLEIDQRKAFQVLGRGRAEPPSGGSAPVENAEKKAGDVAGHAPSISLRQILVPGEMRFWLIVAFSSENTSENDVLALGRSVDSVRFLAE